MTEKELVLLGFKQEFIRESDLDESYYWVLDIVDGLTLISPDTYEVESSDNDVVIELFNTDPSIRWNSITELKSFIEMVTSKIVSNAK